MNQVKKKEAYKWAAGQIRKKIKIHVDLISTLANTAAILKEQLAHFFWIGFYFLKKDHLLLGPFQGPPACMKLKLEKGVCATCVKERKTIIVPDINQFPGHVACDSRSRSEIVIPIFNRENKLKAVLDGDSIHLNDFDLIDQQGLETIARYIQSIWP